MAGNVWELVNDWYGSAFYSASPATNPPGPVAGPYYRSCRGGGWNNLSNGCRASGRYGESQYMATTDIGFRVVRTP